MFPYSISNESIVVVVDGQTHTVNNKAPNFLSLRGSLLSGNEQGVRDNLSAAKSVEAWSNGKFKITDGKVVYEGRALPSDLSDRISKMATAGEDPMVFFRFWERLKSNPSHRSVEQLFSFLNNQGIPLTKDGTFLAYKSVRNNWLDHHSGTIKNEVGKTISMPRHQISDDPQHACHEGLHVGALEYAKWFGGDDRKIIICEVDPKDVVCVPYDHEHQKMRVCEYRIIGVFGGQLNSTTHTEDEYDYECDDECGDECGCEDDDEISVTDLEDEKPSRKVTDSSSDSELDKASITDLMPLSLGRLRSYAALHLKIIGASKIVGGKVSLLDRIESARSK